VRYHRINTKIPEIKLDAADRVDEMLEIAESYPLTESINWLNGFWWAPQKSEAVELSTVE
jgi:hypothetical protein